MSDTAPIGSGKTINSMWKMARGNPDAERLLSRHLVSNGMASRPARGYRKFIRRQKAHRRKQGMAG